MRPESYREQYACVNCMHVFKRTEYDDPPEYYCTLNAPKRPLCMSVSMDEHLLRSAPRQVDAGFETWDLWSDGRGVEAFGICDEHAQLTVA